MPSTESSPFPLKITCTSTDCENDLHCFKKSRSMSDKDKGKCRVCGADLIDWQRVYKREIRDIDYVFKSLKYEYFRHYYWHKHIDEKALANATSCGITRITENARKRLSSSLKPNNLFDGRQTPLEGNIIYYAQHATACCCRKCMEYWHGIDPRYPLTTQQIEYFLSLVMMFIKEKLPDLD